MKTILHFLILFLFSPLLQGIIAKTKAWFAGRKGPSMFQSYYDLVKLCQKGAVYSHVTTLLFQAGPIVSLSCILLASLFVPIVEFPSALAFSGDMILFVYLLSMGRFFTVLAAMDTGSSFEGMGASRDMTFAALVEPAFVLVLIILGLQANTFTLSEALQPRSLAVWIDNFPILFCLSLALGVVILAENSRIPVDDPTTHLELTMVHEVMILDHSGVDLALILYGNCIKFFVTAALMIRALFPLTFTYFHELPIVLIGTLVIAILVGCVESIFARLRVSRVPQFLLGSLALSVLSLCIFYWSNFK